MSRSKIFIGHANPEDNEFTLWLEARLRNEGYDAISDQSLLIGGEGDFWGDLQKSLENECCKYLFVFTKTSFTKERLRKEFDFAETLGPRLGVRDFVMVLKLDDVSFDVRMGIGSMNQFRFDRSWDAAFKHLIRKLEVDRVPKTTPGALSIREWLRNDFNTSNGLHEGVHETHYSNWLEIHPPAVKFWLHEFQTEAQAKAIVEVMSGLPAVQQGQYVVSFSENLPEIQETEGFITSIIKPKRRFSKSLSSIHRQSRSSRFPDYHDIRRLYVRLMKDALEKHLKSLGLRVFFMSSDQPCFYYELGQLPKDKIHFLYEGKTTYRQLVGDYYENKWHYGVTFNVRLNPSPCFSFKGRLLFSDEGKTIWPNAAERQTARKRKGKSFFNEHWRMLLLGFLRSVADVDFIRVPLTSNVVMNVSSTPILFASQIGYADPVGDARLVPLDNIDDKEDESNEEADSEAAVA